MQNIPPQLSTLPNTWFERNWKWVLSLLCVLGLLGIAGLVFLILTLLKSSDAYQGAISRVKNDPAAITALGSPIKEGLFFSGNINMSGSSGRADLAIPISGPKAKATAYVLATKSLGEWHFDHLIIQIDDTKLRIDISEKRGEQPNW